MKMWPVGAESFHADGQTEGQTERERERERDRQTDMTKLIVAFRNFANAPKIRSQTSVKKYFANIFLHISVLLYAVSFILHYYGNLAVPMKD
jgi:hypothetical protein